MSVRDVIKNSFLAAISTGDLSLKTSILRLALTCVFAAYIFIVYRVVTRKVFYNNNFNISLAAVSVIVCAIVIAIQSNLIVSLGMVGALSIVRFRTAVKDPLDLVFLFWAISIGIICGAGMSGIAIAESLILTAGILILDMLPVTKTPMLLVINAQSVEVRESVLEAVKENTKHYQIKSQTTENGGQLSMIIEIRTADSGKLTDEIGKIPEVTRCSLIKHDGETVF